MSQQGLFDEPQVQEVPPLEPKYQHVDGVSDAWMSDSATPQDWRNAFNQLNIRMARMWDSHVALRDEFKAVIESLGPELKRMDDAFTQEQKDVEVIKGYVEAFNESIIGHRESFDQLSIPAPNYRKLLDITERIIDATQTE